MNVEEMKKTVEAMLETLTPARAQRMASSIAGPAEAKEQVSKMAAELLQWSQRSAERLQVVVRREIESQLRTVGVATRADLDALAKRVRALERSASGRSPQKAAKKATKKATAKRAASKRATSKAATSTRRTATTRTGRGRSA